MYEFLADMAYAKVTILYVGLLISIFLFGATVASLLEWMTTKSNKTIIIKVKQ